jgi:hypothetical protein
MSTLRADAPSWSASLATRPQPSADWSAVAKSRPAPVPGLVRFLPGDNNVMSTEAVQARC